MSAIKDIIAGSAGVLAPKNLDGTRTLYVVAEVLATEPNADGDPITPGRAGALKIAATAIALIVERDEKGTW